MKRLLRIWKAVTAALAITVLAATPAAQAEKAPPPYRLTVAADRADSLYGVGEIATFTAKLLRDGQPAEEAELSWSISKDGVPPIESGLAKVEQGEATFRGKLGEPGFLLCRVTYQAPSKTTLAAVCGVGIDPWKIAPSLPVPDDFDAFWSGQKARLAQVPINARLTRVPSPRAGVECFDVQADCVGPPVSGYFARPAGAQPKSLPIILTVHGAGVRSASLAAAAGWAGRDFLAMDLNAHGIPNGRPEAFYRGLAEGELKDYRVRGRESRDTVYFLGMFLRLVRAIDFLAGQPEWDGRTLVVHGSSQGGAQSIVAAGLDPRVTFFAAGVPAMCDHTGVVVGRVNGWPKFIPQAPGDKPDPKVVQAVRYYDAMNFATRTKAACIVTVGFVDATCPPTSVYAMYNALRGPKEMFHDPPSGHAVSPRAGEAMRRAIHRHVSQMREAARARGAAP